MSYENVPKNLTEQAVLTRGGRPDYSKLEAAAFPTPTADEAGAILENTDTGNRYRWSGTTWVQTENIGFPVPLEISARGGSGIPVFIQDQTTGVLDVPFLRNLGTPTLAVNTVVGSRDVTLTAGHGAVVGNILEIADNTNGSFFTQCTITAVVVNVITLDCPVNRIYTTTGSLVSLSDAEMNVDGSVTPVIFSILPFSLQRGDMVRMIAEIRDNAVMDFSTFGGLAALTNGCVVRVNNGDGTYRNLYNFKDHGDIIEQCFDHEFFPNNGGGLRAFTSRLTWGGTSKHGVVIRLDGSLGTGESLEFIVQDDLTGLVRMHWTCQGSEIQD